jgi:septal ring factor EnvC (AmiA/AmiB activator)
MKRPIVYIVILGVICTALGIAIGIAVEKIYTQRHFPEIIMNYLLTHPPEERQRARMARILKRLNQELELSPQQVEKVKVILKEALPAINQARDELKNTLADVRKKTIAKISGLLSTEQKEKFKKLIAQSEKRWEKIFNQK